MVRATNHPIFPSSLEVCSVMIWHFLAFLEPFRSRNSHCSLRLKHIPGFQIKQPMIEDIRSDTVAWWFLNLLSNYISLPGLFLTPRTRNDLSSRPLSVDRCLSPGLLLCVQLPLVSGLLSVRNTRPYTLGTPNSIAIALAPHLNSYRSYFNHGHLSPTIVFQPQSYFKHDRISTMITFQPHPLRLTSRSFDDQWRMHIHMIGPLCIHSI
jgi:hypothetical protein